MFEIVMGIDDFQIQLVKYWIWRLLPENDSRKNVLFLKTSAEGQLQYTGFSFKAQAVKTQGFSKYLWPNHKSRQVISSVAGCSISQDLPLDTSWIKASEFHTFYIHA